MIIRKDTTIRTLKAFAPSNRGFERSVYPRPGGMPAKKTVADGVTKRKRR